MSTFGESVFDDSSEQDDSSCDSCSASVITSSGSLQGRSSHPTRRTTTSRPSPFATVRTSSASNSITHVPLSDSADSELHFPSSTCSVLGSCPSSSAPGPGQAGDYASSTSWSHINASSADSQPWQTSWPSSSCSSDTSGSDEADSISGESEPGQTPAETLGTSDTSPEEDNVFIHEQDPENQVVVIPPQVLFEDLVLPDESSIFSHASHDGFDYIIEALEQLAKGDTSPWAPGGDDSYDSELESCICAPPPGLGYREFYSRAREDRQRHERKARKKARSSRQNGVVASSWDGGVLEASDYTDDIPSSVHTHSRSNHENFEEIFRENSLQSSLRPVLDFPRFSAEILTSLLYPTFTYAHLSPWATTTFTTDLVARILSASECYVGISLGFGPPLNYDIYAFTPKNREELQTFRKLAGEETLEIQESLPITLAFFESEIEANRINNWLEGIIDSPSDLRDYLACVQRRRKGRDMFVQLLDCIIGWYLTSKNNLFGSAHTTSRAALKLLMTSTLLTLVPKLESIPEPLSQYISAQHPPLNGPYISLVAPKLVNRQIKTSIHYLQNQLVCSLFCYLECGLRLDAEVKVVIALLIAFVLELGQKTSRQFAKHATTINSKVIVTPQQVEEYEEGMNTQVLGKLRNSVRNTVGNLGDFGESVRGMGLDLKGKSKEGDEHNDEESSFVSAILTDVLYICT